MQVVVDVDDEVYNDVLHCAMSMLPNVYPFILASAIADGTVLPKGHGDLIDRRELLYHSKCTYRYDCSASGGSQCDKCSDNCVEVRAIESASAVIEADRSEEKC